MLLYLSPALDSHPDVKKEGKCAYTFVVHLFSNVVNQEQGNTIVKGQVPLSSEILSTLGYNDLQTKVMKDMLSLFIMIRMHRDNECNPPVPSLMYFTMYT
jgi:hypothetical protein